MGKGNKKDDPETTAAESPPESGGVIEEEIPPFEQQEEAEEEKKETPISGTKIHQGIASMVARVAYFAPLVAEGDRAAPATLAQGYVGFVVETLDFLEWHECLDVLSDLSKKARLWIGVGALAVGLIVFPAPILSALKKKKPPTEEDVPEKAATEAKETSET